MNLTVRVPSAPPVDAAGPLHRRAPAVDDHGRPLSDFMMILPGLRDASPERLRDRVAGIQAVLTGFEQVVFAELNVPLNVLWVSLVPEFGLSTRIAAGIRARIPEALLVAPDTNNPG